MKRVFAALAGVGISLAPPVWAGTAVAVNTAGKIFVLDTASRRITQSTTVATEALSGDCALTADGSTAYVSSGTTALWTLQTSNAEILGALAAGIYTEDVSISPNEQYVLASSASTLSAPVIATSTSTGSLTGSTSSAGWGFNAMCDDGHRVLAGTPADNGLALFDLGSDGSLSSLRSGSAPLHPVNAACALGSATAVVVSNEAGFFSVGLDDLSVRDSIALEPGDEAVSAAFSLDGSVLYVRTTMNLLAYSYDASAGSIGDSPIWVHEMQSPGPDIQGIDQIAVADTGEIVVSDGAFIGFVDPATGTLNAVNNAGGTVTGVCTSTEPSEPPAGSGCPINDPSYTVIRGTSGPDTLQGTSAKEILLGFGGNDVIDGSGGDDCIDGGAGRDRIKGGRGSDSCYTDAADGPVLGCESVF